MFDTSMPEPDMTVGYRTSVIDPQLIPEVAWLRKPTQRSIVARRCVALHFDFAGVVPVARHTILGTINHGWSPFCFFVL